MADDITFKLCAYQITKHAAHQKNPRICPPHDKEVKFNPKAREARDLKRYLTMRFVVDAANLNKEMEDIATSHARGATGGANCLNDALRGMKHFYKDRQLAANESEHALFAQHLVFLKNMPEEDEMTKEKYDILNTDNHSQDYNDCIVTRSWDAVAGRSAAGTENIVYCYFFLSDVGKSLSYERLAFARGGLDEGSSVYLLSPDLIEKIFTHLPRAVVAPRSRIKELSEQRRAAAAAAAAGLGGGGRRRRRKTKRTRRKSKRKGSKRRRRTRRRR
jgi:hypothetical protein